MTNRLTVHATYTRNQITNARKDAFARATNAANILTALNQTNVINAWTFGAVLRSCVRHAAKKHGMSARDLWAIMPEDLCERIEDAAGVYIYTC